jgi:hypothetical protein
MWYFLKYLNEDKIMQMPALMKRLDDKSFTEVDEGKG